MLKISVRLQLDAMGQKQRHEFTPEAVMTSHIKRTTGTTLLPE